MAKKKKRQRGWMLVKLADEGAAVEVAEAIWKANKENWLKAKDSKAKLGWVSRADVVRLDAAMAEALGCTEAIIVPVTLAEDASPEDAIEAIKGYAGEGTEVFWLEAQAHYPEMVQEEVDLEAQAPALPVPMPLDKKEPSEDTSLDKLRGHNPWG